MAPNRRIGGLPHLGNILDRKALMVSQDKHGSLFRGQGIQRCSYPMRNLLRYRLLIWRRVRVGRVPAFGFLIPRLPGNPSSPTTVVETEVHQNTVKPGVETCSKIEAFQVGKSPKECLLRKILRLFTVTREVERDAI